MTTNTQIGADGLRWPTGTAPEAVRSTALGDVTQELQDSAMVWHRQSAADMLAGNGMADGGNTLTGAGFIIPHTWDYINVDIMWGKLDDLTTEGDISLGARLTWYDERAPFGSPYFGGHASGGATESSEDYPANYLRVTTVVLGEQVQGAILSLDYGRVETLGATGSRATALEAADTASIAAGEAGVFAVVVYPAIAEGRTSREGRTWRR